MSILPVDAPLLASASTPSWLTPRSTRCWLTGRAADRRRRHRPAPPRRAGRAGPAPGATGRGPASAGSREAYVAAGPEALHAELARRAPWAAETVDAARSQPTSCATWNCTSRGSSSRLPAPPAMDGRHPPPDAARRPRRWNARRSTRASTPASTRWSPAGAARRGPRRQRGRRVGDRPQGAGLRRAAGRRRRGDEAPHAQLRASRQLTWMRKLAGVEIVDVTGRGAEEVAAELLARRHR